MTLKLCVGFIAIMDIRSRLDPRLLSCLVVAGTLGTIATVATLLGSLYDDEIANIQIVASHDLPTIIHTVNSVDVHPAGSYLINKWLHDLLHSWAAVKIIGGWLNALGYACFTWFAYEKLQPRARPWAIFILATTASVVLWGASVRWYAYFNPVFAATLGIILFSDWRLGTRSVILGMAAVVLFYLSYAAFCAVPVLLIIHVGREFHRWPARDIRTLALVAGLALLACLPQLIVFATVQATRTTGQTGSALQSALQLGMTLVLGNAVFPIAFLPGLYAGVTLLVLGWLLMTRQLSPSDRLTLVALLVGVACMIATGIGVKPRNSVFLLPLMTLLLAAALASLPPWPRAAAAALVVIYQAVGIWNVVAHVNTTKGSYNTDFRGIMADIHAWQHDCGALVVVNHDPVLSYLLQEAQITQSSPYSFVKRKYANLETGDCIIAVKTYRGVVPLATIQQLDAPLSSDAAVPLKVHDIGPDPYHDVKQWIAHDVFPTHYAHVELWQVRRPTNLLLVSAPDALPTAGG
jgi:hypothetical protein